MGTEGTAGGARCRSPSSRPDQLVVLDGPMAWRSLRAGRASLSGGDAYRGSPVVIKMGNPNWPISNTDGGGHDDEGLLAGVGGRRRRWKTRSRSRGCCFSRPTVPPGAWRGSPPPTVALGSATFRPAGPTPTPPRGNARAWRRLPPMSVLLLAVELAPYSYGWGRLAGAPIQNLGRFYVHSTQTHQAQGRLSSTGPTPAITHGPWCSSRYQSAMRERMQRTRRRCVHKSNHSISSVPRPQVLSARYGRGHMRTCLQFSCFA